MQVNIRCVAEASIRKVVEFRPVENIPLKVDEVYFEYQIIRDDKQADALYISVSAIPKTVIENYANTCVAAGFFPISFEVESKMVAQSVIQKNDKRAYIIVNVKDDSTVLSLVSEGIVRFSSSVAVGTNLIEESLAKINTEKKSDESDSFYSLLNIFSIVKDEVEKFIDYSKSKSGTESFLPEKIEKIILCGKSASLPGFATHLGQHIDIQVVFANVWTNVFNLDNRLPSIPFKNSLDFATPIGLAMPYLRK